MKYKIKQCVAIAVFAVFACGINTAFAVDSYQVAFQADTGHLYRYSSTGGPGDLQQAMAKGTSPAITALPGGNYQMAFQGSDGALWLSGPSGAVDKYLGMMAATNPSVAALSNGSYQVAFQANTGHLYAYSSTGGPSDLQQVMAKGSSPAITALPGGYQMAFQGSDGALWLAGASGTVDKYLGMMAATSPSVAASSNGSYQVAFQANTGNLYTYSSTGGPADMRIGMMRGTNPSIAALATGGYQMAFQGADGALQLAGIAGHINTGMGMKTGTSPAITALPNGGYQVAFQANTGTLWLYSSTNSAADKYLGMTAGTNPSIAAPVAGSSSLPAAAVAEVEAYCKTLGGNDLEEVNLGAYAISNWAGFPTTLFRYTKTDANGTVKTGTVVLLDPSRNQLARWIVQAVIDATGSYNFANAKTLALYTQAASGFQFPVRGVHWEDQNGTGVNVGYPFRDGVTVQMARFGASYPTRVLTSADLDYVITAPESEVTYTGLYARIQSTTREEYIAAGGKDATAGQAWRTAVRNAYQAAWGNDRNLLMTAKAKSLF